MWQYGESKKPYNYLLIIFIFYSFCGCSIILWHCVYRYTHRNVLNICYNKVKSVGCTEIHYIILSYNNQYSFEHVFVTWVTTKQQSHFPDFATSCNSCWDICQSRMSVYNISGNKQIYIILSLRCFSDYGVVISHNKSLVFSCLFLDKNVPFWPVLLMIVTLECNMQNTWNFYPQQTSTISIYDNNSLAMNIINTMVLSP